MAKETEEQKKARETVEAIAKSLHELAGAVKSLLGGRLKKKAIFILLSKASGLPATTVEQVLEAAATLDKTYLNG